MLFLFILLIDIMFAVGCANLARSKNREPALWGLLGFFFWFLPLIILLVIDKQPERPGAAPAAAGVAPAAPQASLADEIAQWKRLLDDGAITEAEFARKKADLLARG